MKPSCLWFLVSPRLLLLPLAFVALAGTSIAALAQVDGAAAEALMKEQKCSKCHNPTKKKKGPSLQAIAEKYKGDASAESKLLKHITTGPKVKIDDEEEDHDVIGTKDPKQLANLIKWILAR